MNADSHWEELKQDVGYALRTFRNAPGFTALALATLALGIGTSAAILTLVEGILIRPLSVRDQDRVVVLWAEHRRTGADHVPLSYADFREYQQGTWPLEAVAAVDYNGAWPRPVQLNRGDAKMNVSFVSGNLFAVLGAGAEIGRSLTAQDDQPGVPPAVVISYGVWERQFGKDPAILGQSLRFFGKQAEVVGIMPTGFDYPERTEVWAPGIPFTAGADGQSSWLYTHLVARLRHDATINQAKANFDAFLRREGAPYPPGLRDMTAVVTSLEHVITGPVRPFIGILAAAVAVIFFAACATVANLSMVRAMARAHEFATRSALGASRSRMTQQLLTESAVLAVLAGTLSIGVACAAIRGFIALAPAEIPRLDQVRMDALHVGVIGVLSLATVVLFGLAPALWSSRPTQRAILIPGTRSGTTTLAVQRARQAFVAFQIALAMVVLAAAGLLVESFKRLRSVDLGFTPGNVLLVELAVGYGTDLSGDYVALVERLTDQVQSLPGVAAATAAALPPFTGTSGLDAAFVREGEETTVGTAAVVNVVPAPPPYFRTLQIPLLGGRAFAEQDREGATPVVIVSVEVARRTWPGQDPIGQRIRLGRDPSQPLRTVVGVVGDTRYRDYTDIRPSVYVPPRQFPRYGLVYLLVRTNSDPAQLGPQIRRLVPQVVPALYVPAITTVEGAAGSQLAPARMSTVLMTGFALMALILATLGLYGIMATFVHQHQREFGIRMALGAAPRDIRRLILDRALRLTALGLAIGTALALLSTRALRTLLFEVSPTDVRVLVATAGLLAAVALLACVSPARRATRFHLGATLRVE
jgi:predicted permease